MLVSDAQRTFRGGNTERTYNMTTEKPTVKAPQKRKITWYWRREDSMWPRP